MCSIIGSFNKEKFKELVKLNQFRGNFSYSLTILDTINLQIKSQIKNFGQFPINKLDELRIESTDYIIGHVQAPTGGMVQDSNRIHPTNVQNSYLWHNGIITNRGIKYLHSIFGTDTNFDTELLNRFIYSIAERDWNELSGIEGLFSCLYLHKQLQIFRTKHGKLYIDEELSISSERFDNSKCINYDTIYNFDFINKKVNIIGNFSTFKFNYIVAGELL